MLLLKVVLQALRRFTEVQPSTSMLCITSSFKLLAFGNRGHRLLDVGFQSLSSLDPSFFNHFILLPVQQLDRCRMSSGTVQMAEISTILSADGRLRVASVSVDANLTNVRCPSHLLWCWFSFSEDWDDGMEVCQVHTTFSSKRETNAEVLHLKHIYI